MALSPSWPSASYEEWRESCDTLHAHTQVLGKLAAELAPPEPQLQHAALRLTARGWETAPLPTPNGSGALVVALDLHRHQAVAEHSDGREARIDLAPNRAVGEVTRELLRVVGELGGPVEIDPTPQEVSWTVPLDEDEEHATYDPDRVASYFAAATQAAQVLTAFRAPYRGRSTPVNAWWGSFDLAVGLFDAEEEIAVGWWPGYERHERAAFYAYVRPAPPGFAEAELEPTAARWDEGLGEYVLEWDDVRGSEDPHAFALQFARSVFDVWRVNRNMSD